MTSPDPINKPTSLEDSLIQHPRDENSSDKPGKSQGHEFKKITNEVTEGAGCSRTEKGFASAAVAFAVFTLVVGVIGLLVYLNILQLGLQNVGTMSSDLGLYTMLAGFGASFIAGVLLTVGCSSKYSKPKENANEVTA